MILFDLQKAFDTLDHDIDAANKYYSSASHHEKKNKKNTSQITFLAVTIKQKIKLVLQHSPCK